MRGGIDSSWVGPVSGKEGWVIAGVSNGPGMELKLKRALTRPNFPLSKEQAPNRLAKGRTVLAQYRNKQQRAFLWENAEGLGVIDMNRLPENALHPTRRGPM